MNKIFQQLLEVRGVNDDFLRPKYGDLPDPLNLPDMEKAVARILKAKKMGEKVLIYGDYDVDGVTATAIMKRTLGLLGITEVETMLPNRFTDGYGMSKRLVVEAIMTGVGLVITVDCGSNNAEIIDALAGAGISTVVTDHHELAGAVSGDGDEKTASGKSAGGYDKSSGAPTVAEAVVNPKRKDFKDIYGLRDLSGAGVAFMLAKALADRGEIPAGQEKWLMDLAATGIICDSMRITGVNRIICYYGLLVLAKTRWVGLRALMEVSGVKVKGKRVSTDAVGFQIGPRLNAAGRMETADTALSLLLTDSKVEAASLAAELDKLNGERKRQQEEAVTEVEKATEDKGETAGGGEGAAKNRDGENTVSGLRAFLDGPVMVVTGKWHEGVLGIIAGRLTEKYKKPSFVLTEVDGCYKGSGRSFGEYNLALALGECQKLLISGGGHAEACGVKLSCDKLEEFVGKVNSYYKSLKLKDQERFLEIKPDLEVAELKELNLELMEELKKLEPYGEGNPEPVFLLPEMMVLDVTRMGSEGQHLRMLIRDDNGATLKLVAFFAPEKWLTLQAGGRISVSAQLTENEWQGTRSVEGKIVKIFVD